MHRDGGYDERGNLVDLKKSSGWDVRLCEVLRTCIWGIETQIVENFEDMVYAYLKGGKVENNLYGVLAFTIFLLKCINESNMWERTVGG
jgi:hypothetical protein